VASVFLLLAPVTALGQIFSTKAVCSPPLSLYSSGPYVPVGGEACEHDGYIIWSAAGGSPQHWNSIISGNAPMNAGLMDVFDFLPADGSSTVVDLDVSTDDFSQVTPNANEVQIPMTESRPYSLRLLGVYGEASNYRTLFVGPIRVRQFCPDQATCMNVRPQLSYIATSGGTPYFNLNVNTIWDEEFGPAFSGAVTVSNGSGTGFLQNASFAVMNADTVTLTPNVCLYTVGSADAIVCKQTAPLAPLQNLGVDLQSLFGSSMIPVGFTGDTLLLKVCVSVPSHNKIGVVVYQFTSLAATSVTVQPDVGQQ
jgi:hypothetical protein